MNLKSILLSNKLKSFHLKIILGSLHSDEDEPGNKYKLTNPKINIVKKLVVKNALEQTNNIPTINSLSNDKIDEFLDTSIYTPLRICNYYRLQENFFTINKLDFSPLTKVDFISKESSILIQC